MLIYLLFIIPPMLLALWAQYKVKSTFAAAHEVPATSGLTGAQVAQMILEANDIRNVGIEPSHGFLSDHYDPRAKMLRLSPDVYEGRSVASLGIAAHEVGHAIQDATRYPLLVLRNGIVPFAAVGLNLAMIVIMIAMIGIAGTLSQTLLLVGIGLFSLTVFFQLVNLPVEFDASRRAKDTLFSTGLVAQGVEQRAMSKMLSAAAMTYVAATISSIATLLYYVLIFISRGQNSRD